MVKEELRRAALERALRASFDEPVLTPRRLVESTESWIARQLDRLLALDAWVLMPGDPDYPRLLVGIPDEPTALFARGRRPAAEQPAVAIVGSRRPSPSGLRFAAELARLLVRHGLTVVSGMARGIDGEAHRAALAAAGDPLPSIGVLATGLDASYPPEHRALQQAMAERALLLTEFPPGAAPLKHHFLRRNRLLSGLAHLVVVVEARERSGALLTVKHALEQGRDVGTVPGDVYSEASAGSNGLLVEGATPFTSPGAVLEFLIQARACAALPARTVAGRRSGDRSPGAVAGSDRLAALAERLSSHPVTIEELARATGRTVPALLADLLDLEMAGVARRWSGGFVRG
jgi:DNA processing protein